MICTMKLVLIMKIMMFMIILMIMVMMIFKTMMMIAMAMPLPYKGFLLSESGFVPAAGELATLFLDLSYQMIMI